MDCTTVKKESANGEKPLFLVEKQKENPKGSLLFLAETARFARLASALVGTHAGTETVHWTVSS